MLLYLQVFFDSNDNNIKTHEFNYANKATFNISDNLTDKTGAENILFGSGVSYDYPDGNLVCSIYAERDYGMDEVESNQNDALFEEIESDPTSQGYKTYIFKWDDMNEYDVFIDLDNLTIVEDSGYDEQYKYFKGKFETLDEAQVFIDTFKINEDQLNKQIYKDDLLV
ncbi:MAG: hypothetical protein ACI389_01180 [Methanobrevibacter sp.]|uniref:hypothetical protein n=1 Tax=Methanobrevibacter sp. TaxID=66852 RepID=UPI003F0ED84F